MKIYEQFHGDIGIKNIGKELRKIVFTNKENFKILTGYGSTTGISLSKHAAVRSLKKMKKEKIISGFLPGEIKDLILGNNDPLYEDKVKYANLIKNDPDFGNEGVIFIFVK